MTRQPDLDDLEACVDELLGRDRLHARVRALLPLEVATGYGDPDTNGAGTHAAPSAPIPWNDAAADWVVAVHAAVRLHERNLSLLAHRSAKYRGSSEANTAHALHALPDLVRVAAEKHGPEHRDVVAAVRALQQWPRRARAILDEARTHEIPWTKAPGDLRCPHCNRRLELRPGWERDRAPDLWCRRCPAQLDPEEPPRPDRSWPADAWIAVLQQPKGA